MATEDTEVQTDDQNIIEGESEAILDDDDLALQEVEKSVAEEEAESEGAAEAEGEGQAEPAEAAEEAQAEGEGAAQPEASDIPTIPKPRFDQVAQERDQWRDQALRMQGQIEAFQVFQQQPGGTQQEQQPAEQTPEQKIAGFRDEQKAIAKRFDDGEISAEDMETERQRLDDEIWNVRQGALTPPATQDTTQTGQDQRTDLYLNEKFDQLETQYPYTKLIEGEPNWAFLSNQAVAELKAEGMETIDPNNPAHELAVRTRMAELTDKYGPVMTGKTVEQPNGSQQQQSGQQPNQMSPQAKARNEKLSLANELPPDIGAAGGSGQGDVWTEERMLSLSEEEFENLPASTRDALNRKYGDGASP